MPNTASSHGRGVLIRIVHTHAKTQFFCVDNITCSVFFWKALLGLNCKAKVVWVTNTGWKGKLEPPPPPNPPRIRDVTRFLFTSLLRKMPFIARPDEAWASSGSNSDSCYIIIFFLQVVLSPLCPVPFKKSLYCCVQSVLITSHCPVLLWTWKTCDSVSTADLISSLRLVFPAWTIKSRPWRIRFILQSTGRNKIRSIGSRVSLCK